MRIGKFKILIGLAAIGVAVAIVYARTPDYEYVTGTDIVSFDTNSIPSDSARAYCYVGKGGEKLHFILARGNDGKVSSVFDACSQCYTYHRGYKIARGEVICRVCGNRYPVGRLREGKASCVPVALPHQEDSGQVKIKTSDLESGRWLF